MKNDDRLQEIWNIQKQFNDKFFNKKLDKNIDDLSLDEKISWTKNQLLSIVKETMEVLDEVPNWKEHRNISGNFVISNLLEEVIDVTKFTIGLAQIWGMNDKEFYEQFLRKSYVVDQRWQQEHELNLIDKDSKICGIDIDGVLGRYHEWFTHYAKSIHGIPVDSFDELKSHLTPDRYQEIKDAYRQSGWKANMPPTEGASELTHLLKAAGYQIIILTARPYKEYSRIYPDTLEFLKKNDILFDAIIWDEEKHLKIIKEFPNLEFMIEDTSNIAEDVAKAGYPVYVPEGPNNINYDFGDNHNILKIKNLKDLIKFFNVN